MMSYYSLNFAIKLHKLPNRNAESLGKLFQCSYTWLVILFAAFQFLEVFDTDSTFGCQFFLCKPLFGAKEPNAFSQLT